jgi:AraC family transcriptional regulator
MVTSLNLLTQQNFDAAKRVATTGNIVNYSEVSRVAFRPAMRGFSIKYVLDGRENYRINGREYAVRSGEYLLAPPACQALGWVDSPVAVRGICVDLPVSTMAEVAATLRRTDQPEVEPRPADAFVAAGFQEQLFRGEPSNLGGFLNHLGHAIGRDVRGEFVFDAGFFYTLCELYLFDFQKYNRHLLAIRAVKTSTRQELYRRLLKGRDFMEDCFTRPIEIEDVARSAQISEYQFFRLFKAVFGITPYQFILQKRLELGCELLQTGQSSISDIALKTGFADIFSFSKAFKKRFGVSPSAIQPGLKTEIEKAVFDKHQQKHTEHLCT